MGFLFFFVFFCIYSKRYLQFYWFYISVSSAGGLASSFSYFLAGGVGAVFLFFFLFLLFPLCWVTICAICCFTSSVFFSSSMTLSSICSSLEPLSWNVVSTSSFFVYLGLSCRCVFSLVFLLLAFLM